MVNKSVWATSAGSGIFTSELTPDLFLILDSLSDGVYGVDATGRTVMVNKAAADMLGYLPGELIGTVPHDVMHHRRPDGTPFPREECPLTNAAREGREIAVEEDVFWRRDGSSFAVSYESHCLRRDGAIVGMVLTFRDISRQKKHDERMRELLRDQFALAKAEFQHAQLRDVLAQTPAIICVTRGPKHVIEVVNDQFRELIGGIDVVGRAIADAFPNADPTSIEMMDLAYRTGIARKGQERPFDVEGPSGVQTKYFDYIYQPLRDDASFVYGLMTHAVDVTDEVVSRRALEARTQELERVAARLRLSAEAGNLGAWEWDVRAQRVMWSPELERIHGLEPGTFDGTFEAYQRDIHPDDREYVFGRIQETIELRAPHRLEYRIVRPDGEIRWVEARGQMFLDADGEPERLVGICMDVTDRKSAERFLVESNRRAELTAAVGLSLSRAADLRGMLQDCTAAVVTYLDAAFARIWTVDAAGETLELQASSGLYTHLDGPHSRVPVGRFKIGLIAQERLPHLTNDVLGDPRVGDQAWARREGLRAFAGYPLLIGDELVGVLAMFSRATLTEAHLQALSTVAYVVALGIQRWRADERLRARADELAALTADLVRTNHELDAFAYAASHDLRAPLRGIANLAQWIEEDLTLQGSLPADTREMLALMRTRMHRMEALIEGILQYSRAGKVAQEQRWVATRQIVREALDLAPVPEGALVTIGELPEFFSDPLPLQQIFLNLIGNAFKYANRPDPEVTIDAQDAGDFYEFRVADNGPGIPAEYHERIWGIFQTLEARDKVEGTGIGLSLVKKLVEGHGGRAWVESAPGAGATFKFTWPKSMGEK